jgi:two-component system LytT family response regulator
MSEATLRVLIVDDEQPARERLARLLASDDRLQVVDHAEDGEQAIQKIVETTPDLVFLDIQMPGCSGLEVAASLPAPRPQIVFCTAYDEHAVDAFELHAVDYLLKPVNRARLAKAVDRVMSSGRDEQTDRAIDRAGPYPTRFLARRGNRYQVVPRDEVLCFVSEGGLTTLHTAGNSLWMQPTLSDLEQRLDPQGFFRISRSAIVNLDAVRELKPIGGGHADLHLSDGQTLEVSRRRFKPLIDKLGEV